MRNAIIALAGRRNRAQNPGLVLQRFLARAAAGEDGDPEERRALLAAARSAASDSELRTLYTQAFQRWTETVGRGCSEFAELTTTGRLIVGLGSENVLETGLRLHHTYGLPIIPGSALKGLTAHYCDHVWGQRHLEVPPDENKPFRRPISAEDEAYRAWLRGSAAAEPPANYFRLLFGNTDDGGVITFHDAWITPDSLAECLCLDVMTPHHQAWQDSGKVAPTDFDSPIPVAFLSVRGKFQVVVSWSGPLDHPQAKTWTARALGLVKEALENWGIGGKTSSGYGRLSVPPPPPPPPPPALNMKARVTILERREMNGKTEFKVQEAGRPRPGWLKYGTPPPTLPQVGETVEVYWNNTDLNNPQYRWDVSQPPPPPPPGRGNRPRR